MVAIVAFVVYFQSVGYISVFNIRSMLLFIFIKFDSFD